MKALLAGDDAAIEEAAANLAEVFATAGNEVSTPEEEEIGINGGGRWPGLLDISE